MTRIFPIFLLLLLSAIPRAEEPSWKKDLSPPTLGSHPPLPEGILNLKVSWNGMIDSGDLCIHFDRKTKKPLTYVVSSTASSTGAAAALFPYNSHFWTELDQSSLRPRLFHSVESDNRESIDTTTVFTHPRVTCRETCQPLPKGTPKTTERTFNHSPVHDMFSAMLHIRSQKLDSGDQIQLVVQPFKTPYLLKVKVAGRESHLNRNTIRLQVGMQKIDPKSMRLLPYKKLKKDATIWLSDDDDRIPVEFRAAIFIGDIRATLAGYQKL